MEYSTYLDIYGKFRKFTPVGYCNNNKHRGYLSKGTAEKHHCLEKKCAFFIKKEILSKKRKS